MRRSTRAAVALSITAVVTAFAWATSDSVVLTAGVTVVYGVGLPLYLRADVRRLILGGGTRIDRVFAGVAVWGVLSLAQGVTPSFNLAAPLLGFGLVQFGYVCGVASLLDTDGGARAHGGGTEAKTGTETETGTL